MTALLEKPATATWASGIAVAGAAWIALIVASGEALFTLETLRALCAPLGAGDWAAFPFMGVAAMWLLMSVAMMLPTALPTIGLYAQLMGRELRGGALYARVAVFAGGYLIVWGAASIALAAAQASLGGAADMGGRADAVGPGLAGVLLLVAGLYQFSALKKWCLAKCRNPMAFFFAHWREGARGALAMGARHGVLCAGCCWALMALMFVFGVMNVAWMAALGALMLLEKAGPKGDIAGRWIGISLIAAGAAVLMRLSIS